MGEVEQKYHALTFEYSRLRARFQNLREHFLLLHKELEAKNNKLVTCNRTSRRMRAELDSLTFRNNQYVKRISLLQEPKGVKEAVECCAPDPESSAAIQMFVEVTKNQVASMVEENDKLSQKIIEMSTAMEDALKEKSTVIEVLKKENKKLKLDLENMRQQQQSCLKTNTTNSDHITDSIAQVDCPTTIMHLKIDQEKKNRSWIDEEGRGEGKGGANMFAPCPIPRKVSQRSEQTFVSCLTALFAAVKNLVSEVLDSLRHSSLHDHSCDSRRALELLKVGHQKILTWKAFPPVLVSRFGDCAAFLRTITGSLSILISQLKVASALVWKLESLPVLFYPLQQLGQCLTKVERLFTTLDALPSRSVTDVHDVAIEKLFICLRGEIIKAAQLIKAPSTNTVSDDEIKNSMLVVLSSLIKANQAPIADSINLLAATVDVELPIFRLHGWWPNYFHKMGSTNKKESGLLSPYSRYSFYLRFQKYLALSNQVPSASISPSTVVEEGTNSNTPHVTTIHHQEELTLLLKQLEQSKLHVDQLMLEREQLLFDLKSSSLLNTNTNTNCDNCSQTSSITPEVLRELRSYVYDRVESHLLSVQQTFSQVNLLDAECHNLRQRLILSESNETSLQQDVKRLTSLLQIANDDLSITRKSYEDRLIELMEEICNLRSATNTTSTFDSKSPSTLWANKKRSP